MSNDSISKTLIVAISLCVVCSVVVSLSAVTLRPLQVAKEEENLKRNILEAAGMYDPAQKVEEQFAHFKVRIVDLESGTFTDAVDADSYDEVAAAKDPNLSNVLSKDQDIAKISRQEKYAKVYTVEDENGIETLVLPIRGYGLWSTLYGFIALESDLNTVIGLGFYDQKETPGLGGEVDNPRWKALWHGKQIYGDSFDQVAIAIIKGTVDVQNDPKAKYKVDGLSGASLTSRGVHNMLHFWMGEHGYAKFLANLKQGDA